ncbi:uncharacterized protein NPIL_230371 [Nephila pilipes]|uniref:Uncharacterized protein n=1 Tax=Nephila pilipes TaxID=299642 RepID=A0A8X6P465_NEPPI|nr:uncharacterized protein NPIL_230371 [Nephila pilipes]
MQSKVSECIVTLVLRDLKNPLCYAHSELDECLKKEAKECDVENSSIVQDLLETYSETCTEGTPMNTMFEKHRSCLYERAAMVSLQCMQPILKEIIALGSPSEDGFEDKVLKLGCQYDDSLNECINDGIEDICGEEAVTFRRDLVKPSSALSIEACKLVREESNDVRHVSRLRRHASSFIEMPPHISYVAASNHHAAALYMGSNLVPNYE